MIDLNISERGLDLIKGFEGFRAITYEDVCHLPTIGYGHRLRAGETFTTLDEATASQLLRQDCRHAEAAISQCVNVPLNQNQYDALVSFTYNVGGGTLLKSTLLKKLNQGDYAGAAQEFLRFNHAGSVVVDGLTRRRTAERALFLSAATSTQENV